MLQHIAALRIFVQVYSKLYLEMTAVLLTPESVSDFAELIANVVAEKMRKEARTINPLVAMPDRFLNLGETCKELGISRPTLRKLIQRGHLVPAFHGTRTPRFRLSDIQGLDRDSIKKLTRLY
jgi:excisionase family DNA binding protein